MKVAIASTTAEAIIASMFLSMRQKPQSIVPLTLQHVYDMKIYEA